MRCSRRFRCCSGCSSPDRSRHRITTPRTERTSMPATTLDPRTALVIIDLQRGIAAMRTAPHESSDIIARNAELARTFRKAGLPVALVRVTWSADGSDMPPGRTEAPRRSGGLPEGWDELIDELDVQPTDIIITKR